jgi:O-antigen/teichoic acid export membrane protein
MKSKLKAGFGAMQKSSLFTNSFWGIIASALQNLFLSIFFVLIARVYATEDFAQYLIANALYQLLAVFSTFGLSKWFIREVVNTADKGEVINRFFKIQLYFGLTFYVVNLALAYALYDNHLVHVLAFLFGFNIILDNLIYAIKSLNIAEAQQIKTFKIQIIDSFLLFLSAAVLLVYPFSIIWLAIIQVIIRAITINLFLKIGSSDLVNIRRIAQFKVLFSDIRQLIYTNWTFVIIGSISLIYWRSADIIVSKTLTLTDVAIYGISYKVFQLALIIPYIISTTVFPALVKKFSEESLESLRKYYQEVFLFYFAFGLLAFTFIYSYADFLMPLVFGSTYADAAIYTKLMFLAILVFPTAMLQANLLVAIKLERFDMIFNVVSLVLYLIFSFVGLYYIKSLKVINYSIFASFLIFHMLQDVLLIKRGIVTLKHALMFYLISGLCVMGYLGLVEVTGQYLSFIILWLLVGIGMVLFLPKVNRRVKMLVLRKGAQG